MTPRSWAALGAAVLLLWAAWAAWRIVAGEDTLTWS